MRTAIFIKYQCDKMRKIISIFLLLLMMVIGAHPVLAMHFCGGELYSFGILSNEVEDSCCEYINAPQEANSSCDIDTNTQDSKRLLSHKDCCNIQKVELSTDEYQNQTQQFSLNKILPSFQYICLALNLLIPTDNGNVTKTNQNFPPGGFCLQNTDLLSYICTYQI